MEWATPIRGSLPDDLDQNSLGSPAVEFAVEDLLPGSEVELPLGDRDDDLAAHDLALVVGVGVVFAGLVVAVFRARGGELFKPLADIGDEPTFEVVYVDGRGDVHGGDKAQAVADAASFDNLLDLVGDVDHFVPLFGFKHHVFGMALHRDLQGGGKESAQPLS